MSALERAREDAWTSHVRAVLYGNASHYSQRRQTIARKHLVAAHRAVKRSECVRYTRTCLA